MLAVFLRRLGDSFRRRTLCWIVQTLGRPGPLEQLSRGYAGSGQGHIGIVLENHVQLGWV
jgi:hypothetical protein